MGFTVPREVSKLEESEMERRILRPDGILRTMDYSELGGRGYQGDRLEAIHNRLNEGRHWHDILFPTSIVVSKQSREYDDEGLGFPSASFSGLRGIPSAISSAMIGRYWEHGPNPATKWMRERQNEFLRYLQHP